MASSSSTSFSKFLLTLLICFILFHINTSTAARAIAPKSTTEFIRTSCSSTTYPNLCYTSLSVHANKIQFSQKLLTSTALNVTLESAKSTSAMMVRLSKTQGLSSREVGAMKDCVEELGDAVEEIRISIDEMSRSETADFQMIISDVQTWVSAALTDENTCSDGFEGNVMNGNVKNTVRGGIVKIAHLTSNALALVNNYASIGDTRF